jgi:hypothetical protein
MFRPGQTVELKVGGSLGSWVPATVLKLIPGCCGKRSAYEVLTDTGRFVGDVGEQLLRRPRRGPAAAPVAVKKQASKKSSRPRTDREPLRYPAYLRWVKSLPCMFCARPADDPHHYGPKGMGQTTDDTRVVPVCRQAHDALHAGIHAAMCAPWPRSDLNALIYQKQIDLVTSWLKTHGELR